MLCDEAGAPLPNQVAVSLRQQVGQMTEIRVIFTVDGEKISFAP
jgi:hypothetical protein